MRYGGSCLIFHKGRGCFHWVSGIITFTKKWSFHWLSGIIIKKWSFHWVCGIMIPQTQWKDHFLWWFHWVCGIIIPQTQWNQPLTKKVIFPLSLWNFNSTDSVESTTYQKKWSLHWVFGILNPQTQWNQPLTKKWSFHCGINSTALFMLHRPI